MRMFCFLDHNTTNSKKSILIIIFHLKQIAICFFSSKTYLQIFSCGTPLKSFSHPPCILHLRLEKWKKAVWSAFKVGLGKRGVADAGSSEACGTAAVYAVDHEERGGGAGGGVQVEAVMMVPPSGSGSPGGVSV